MFCNKTSKSKGGCWVGVCGLIWFSLGVLDIKTFGNHWTRLQYPYIAEHLAYDSEELHQYTVVTLYNQEYFDML